MHARVLWFVALTHMPGKSLSRSHTTSSKSQSSKQALFFNRDHLTTSPQCTTYLSALSSNKLGSQNLIEVLCITTLFEATDPRDKLFYLVGLFSAEMAELVPVDYVGSSEELYKDLAVRLLKLDDEALFTILSHTGMSRHSGRLALPSWVVDWSYVPLNHLLPLHGQLNHYKSGWPYPPASYKHKISANLRLTLRGFTFDNIKTLTHHTFGAEIPSDMLLTKEGHLLQIHQACEMFTECEILARDRIPTLQARISKKYGTISCHVASQHPVPRTSTNERTS